MYYRLLVNGLLITVLGAAVAAARANDDVLRLTQDSRYWGYDGGNYHNWRYSGLYQINNKNIGALQAAWSMATGSLQGQGGGPLVLPGAETGVNAPTLFIHTPFPDEVLAVNLENLRLSWVYDSGQTQTSLVQQCCRYRTRGLAYADGRLFLQQADQRLVALEARTGNKLWVTEGAGTGVPNLISSLPYPVRNYLLAGFNTFSRSGITAYRISNGRPLWSAFNSGTDAEALFDAQTRFISGRSMDLGNIQGSRFTEDQSGGESATGLLAWDPQQNLIYYAGVMPLSRDTSSGRNRYTMTLYARDVETGRARWVYQLTPAGGTYYQAPGEMILAEITLDGVPIPAVVHFSSNGFVYIINRVTGELLQARKFDASVNWASAINLDNGRPVSYEEEDNAGDAECPSPIGARGDEPAAYSPHTGLFYVPVRHTCMGYRPVGAGRGPSLSAAAQTARVDSFLLPAGTVMKDGSSHMGMVIAWDGARARPTWSVPEPWPVMSGVLVTAGDVVFYGTLDGYLKAVDAKTGKSLWQFKVPSGVIGNINTWSYKDKQYIGVLSGAGDTTALLAGDDTLNVPVRTGGTLMVFSLP
jgi:PQQ-dependent dehydrogenase (methanol/ethanol family)